MRRDGANSHATRLATQALDAQWRNGFYIVTGMSLDLRNAIQTAIRAIP